MPRARIVNLDEQAGEDRLDLPGLKDKRFRIGFDSERFGHLAEKTAAFMGTGTFLLWMTIFIVVWITFNVVGIWGWHWDPYPFILLNLVFSTQASYAAPLILLAQNRQEARDRVAADEDRRIAAQSRADMDYLAREIAGLRQSVGDLATRDYVRGELRTFLEEMEDDRLARAEKAERKACKKAAAVAEDAGTPDVDVS